MSILLILILLSSYSWADITLPSGKVITDAQLLELQQKLPRTTEEKVFYHWTTGETGIRWSLQGSLDAGEVKFLSTPSGQAQAYGPGIYMAESSTSSKSFGEFAVVYKIPSNTLIYDPAIIASVLKVKELDKKDASALGETLPIIRKCDGTIDWWLFTHFDLAQNIEPGSAYGALPDKQINWDRALNEIKGPQQPKVQPLAEMLSLSRYQDGLSFLRAQTLPNPIAEFEPQFFGSYRNARSILLSKSAPIINKLQTYAGTLGKTPYSEDLEVAKATWAREQINDVLPTIYNEMGNPIINNGSAYRAEGIRAGGDEAGKTFVATRSQYIAMKSNPYIEVEMAPIPNSQDVRVAYFYPDVFHFKKLKGRITDELYSQLSTTPVSQLWSDTTLRQTLNQKIVDELLTDLFKRYYQMPLDLENNATQIAKFIQEFISIHPFGDFSGRSTRFYLEAAFRAAGKEPPYYLLSDLDILLAPEEYGEVLKKSTAAYRDFQAAAISELLDANKTGRPPRYHSLPEYKSLANGIDNYGMIKVDQLTPYQMEMVRKRQWATLFDNLNNPNWRKNEFYDGLFEGLFEPLSETQRADKIAQFAKKTSSLPSKSARDYLDILISNDHPYPLSEKEVTSLIAQIDLEKLLGISLETPPSDPFHLRLTALAQTQLDKLPNEEITRLLFETCRESCQEIPNVFSKYFPPQFGVEFKKLSSLMIAIKYDSIPHQTIPQLKSPPLKDKLDQIVRDYIARNDSLYSSHKLTLSLFEWVKGLPMEERLPMIEQLTTKIRYWNFQDSFDFLRKLLQTLPAGLLKQEAKQARKLIYTAIKKSYRWDNGIIQKFNLCSDLMYTSFGLFQLLKVGGVPIGGYTFYKYFLEDKLMENSEAQCTESGGYPMDFMCHCGGTEFEPDYQVCIDDRKLVPKEETASIGDCFKEDGEQHCRCDINNSITTTTIYTKDLQQCQSFQVSSAKHKCKYISSFQCNCGDHLIFSLAAMEALNFTCDMAKTLRNEGEKKCEEQGRDYELILGYNNEGKIIKTEHCSCFLGGRKSITSLEEKTTCAQDYINFLKGNN